MKILVYGIPRTGSTIIQQCISHYYAVDNYSEIYNVPIEGHDDIYQWTSDLFNGVVKLLSSNLYNVDFEKLIKIGNFDFVVLTTRKNLTDSCISLYYAELTKQYHFTQLPNHDNTTSFICPTMFVVYWIQQYKRYQSSVQFLKDTNIPLFEVDYDDWLNDVPLKINGEKIATVDSKKLSPTINPNFDYKTLCLNYYEIKKLIHESIS